MLQRYRASGRSSTSFLPMVIAMVIGAALLGWVYQKLLQVIPLIYVNVLLTLGFAFVLRRAIQFAADYGRCRSVKLAIGAGVLAAVAGLASSHWTAWQSWQDEVIAEVEAEVGPRADWDEDLRREVANVLGFSEYLDARIEFGWSIGRSGGGLDVSGLFVWLIWLIEAALLIGGGVLGGLESIGKPYCEACDRWADEVVARVVIREPARKLVRAVAAADSASMLFPPTAASGDGARGSHLVYLLRRCATCSQRAFLDVTLRAQTQGEKGKIETEETVLQAGVVVDAEIQRYVDKLRSTRIGPAEGAD